MCSKYRLEILLLHGSLATCIPFLKIRACIVLDIRMDLLVFDYQIQPFANSFKVDKILQEIGIYYTCSTIYTLIEQSCSYNYEYI